MTLKAPKNVFLFLIVWIIYVVFFSQALMFIVACLLGSSITLDRILDVYEHPNCDTLIGYYTALRDQFGLCLSIVSGLIAGFLAPVFPGFRQGKRLYFNH